MRPSKLETNGIIGIDFDNTLISYDEVFFDQALRSNLIGRTDQKEQERRA